MSGAFGSGAAFAFEDAYVLSQAVQHARDTGKPLSSALKVYDKIRSPHYEALYGVLDGNVNSAKGIAAEHPEYDDDQFVEEIVTRGFGKGTAWIYSYDVSDRALMNAGVRLMGR